MFTEKIWTDTKIIGGKNNRREISTRTQGGEGYVGLRLSSIQL